MLGSCEAEVDVSLELEVEGRLEAGRWMFEGGTANQRRAAWIELERY